MVKRTNIILINNLDDVYNSALEVGPQTWVTGRLVMLVATYIQGGSNGITKKVNQLPEDIGFLSELEILLSMPTGFGPPASVAVLWKRDIPIGTCF